MVLSLTNELTATMQSATSSKVRLFALSPDTKTAGMQCSANGTTEIAKGVHYSLGSTWVDVQATSATYTVIDDATSASIVARTETPPAAPLGFTNFLIGLQKATGPAAAKLIALNDAPEGGVCKPGLKSDDEATLP